GAGGAGRGWRGCSPVRGCRPGAGVEHRGRLCGADLLRARRVLRHRRLHVHDPLRACRREPVARALDRRARGRRRRGPARRPFRAAPRARLPPLRAGAAAEVVRIGALNWASLTGGPEGLSILPVSSLANMVFASKAAYAALMLGYLVICYAVTTALQCSRYGYFLLAVRDDEDAAKAAG